MKKQSKWTKHQVSAYEFMKNNPNIREMRGLWMCYGIPWCVVMALARKGVVAEFEGDFGITLYGLKNDSR